MGLCHPVSIWFAPTPTHWHEHIHNTFTQIHLDTLTEQKSRRCWIRANVNVAPFWCSSLKVCHVYESVVSHLCIRQVTHLNEAFDIDEWVMLHICYVTLINKESFTYRNEASYLYEWVVSHIWMRHVAHMNESCQNKNCRSLLQKSPICMPMSHTSHAAARRFDTREWVMLHIFMSHVTHMNDSCHLVNYFMSHIRTPTSQNPHASLHRCVTHE